MKLENYQNRMILEKEELDIKIKKLNRYIQSVNFIKLDTVDRELLIEQYHYMGLYNQILDQRIERFNKNILLQNTVLSEAGNGI